MKTKHRIVYGDSRKVNLLSDRSVHLVITSPPYWQLKDYGTGNQIGYHESYEKYINNLNLVWKECHRVLHPGCRLCINTGGATVMGSFPYPRNGILKLDYEFILIFKKGGNPPKVTKEQKELSVLTREEWNTYFSGHWYFTGAKQDGHLAVFPEELPARLIISS